MNARPARPAATAGSPQTAATVLAPTWSRPWSPARAAALAAALAIALSGVPPASAQDEVPFIVTPDHVTRAMLELARVGPGDHVIDLGSGDGRIVITAARHFGATGLGVEIVPELVTRSRTLARTAGVEARTEFRVQDLFATDLARATVVTMYLLPRVNLQLRPRLLALAPGTRIVSHDWDLGDWTPERTVVVDVPDKTVGRDKVSRLHLWTVPVALHGPWCSEGTPRLQLAIAQRFAAFSGTLEIDDAGAAAPLAVFDGRVEGTRLRTADAGGVDMTWGADGLRLRSAGTRVVVPDGRLFRPGPCSAAGAAAGTPAGPAAPSAPSAPSAPGQRTAPGPG